MAIYGIGAYYDHDVSNDFIKNNIIGVGWNKSSAPELHEYIKSLKVGDIVYIKAAFGGADITVKAIGIITNNTILDLQSSNNLVEIGRTVKWISTKKFVIPKPDEKNNVRNNTLYEEFHPIVQNKIIAEF
jgi:hypothetical protein